jgi:hypothetical protein
MADCEKQIESIGFKVRVNDNNNCYIVYENKKQDQEVILEWDYEDQYCYIYFRKQYRGRKIGWVTHIRCLCH